MENLYKLLIVSLLFVGLTSCEKDIVVIDAFDFEIEAIYQEITTINYPQETKLSILPEKPLEGDKYFFSYTLVEGQGAFLIDGSPVSENENIIITNPELSLNADFVSSSLGIKKVRVEINNNGKVIKIINLIYDVRHNPYSLTMTSPIVNYTENQVIDIDLSLQNVGVDDSITYKRAFFLLEGEGELTRNGDTEPLVFEQFLPLEEGESNYSLVMSTLGVAKLLVRTIDTNGQIKEAILEFNGFTDELNFEVDTNPNHDELFVNANFDIVFNIFPTIGMFDKKMKYTIMSPATTDPQTIIVKSNGAQVDHDTFIDVPTSGSFSWTGLSTLEQNDIIIRFTLENSNGDIITKDLLPGLSFQSGSSAFSFSALPTSIDGNVGTPIQILCAITESGSSGAPYKLRFKSSSSGTLRLNAGSDITVVPGNIVEITVGNNLNFSIFYTGTVSGEHELELQTANAIGEFSNFESFKLTITP